MPRRAEAALARFHEQLAREHAEVLAHAGAVERDLVLGDRRLRLRFAGDTLAGALLHAFGARVAAPAGRPDATIGLWDERAVPGGALPLPWRDVDLGPRGLLGAPERDVVVAVHEAGSGAVTLLDRLSRTILYRVPDVAAIPWWEIAAPLRPALHFALGGAGRHLVHAGAVGDAERGGVLLAGRGGSGKTTVALAALEAGLGYAGDDYVLVRSAGPEPVAFNLYATAKVDPGGLERAPELAPLVRRPARPGSDEKVVLNVSGSASGTVVRSVPLRAVAVPRIAGDATAVRRATPGEALLALAPSTAFQMPFDGGAVLRSLAAVVRGLPCFALDVGADRAELAGAIEGVLEAAAATGSEMELTAP